MADGPISLAGLELIEFLPDPPEFESFAVAELGDAASDADGFPAAFNALVQDFSDGNPRPGLLDAELAESAAQQVELGVDVESPVVGELAPHIADGDVALGAFEGELPPPSATPPDPVPAPAPPPEIGVIAGGGGGLTPGSGGQGGLEDLDGFIIQRK